MSRIFFDTDNQKKILCFILTSDPPTFSREHTPSQKIKSKYCNKIYNKICIYKKEEKRPQKEIAVHTPFPHIHISNVYNISFQISMLRIL